ADAGDDGFLGGAADEAGEVGAHGDAGAGLELYAVLGDGIDRVPPLRRARAVDDLRVHAGGDGLEDVAAGEVDGGADVPVEIDLGSLGGDEGADDVRHAP